MSATQTASNVPWAIAAAVLAFALGGCLVVDYEPSEVTLFEPETWKGWPVVYTRIDVVSTGSSQYLLDGYPVHKERFEMRQRTSVPAAMLDGVFALALSAATFILARAIAARRFTLRELLALMFVASVMLGVFASASACSVPLHPQG